MLYIAYKKYILLLRLPFVYTFLCLRVYNVVFGLYVCFEIYGWKDMNISCQAAKETREHDKMQFIKDFCKVYVHTVVYAISFRDLYLGVMDILN